MHSFCTHKIKTKAYVQVDIGWMDGSKERKGNIEKDSVERWEREKNFSRD